MKKLLFLSIVLAFNSVTINANDKILKEEFSSFKQDLDVHRATLSGLTIATQGTLAYLGKMLWELSSISSQLNAIKASLAPSTQVARTAILTPFALPIALSQVSTGVNAYFYVKDTENMLTNAYEKHGYFAANNIRQGLINAFDGSSW